VSYPRRFVARDGRHSFTAAQRGYLVDGFPSGNVVAYRVQDGVPTRIVQVLAQPAGGGYRAAFAGSSREATYYVSAVESLLAPSIAPARPVTDITSGQATYLMISHPDFIAGLAPLVQAREAEGMTVRVVDVEDVYAHYSGGVFDPQAIAEYIAHAATNMGTEYVLLAGGDTYDYRNYQGSGSMSFIPTLYAETGDIVAVAPVDPLFGDVDGDRVPDLALGRFPVRTSAELDTLVAKTLAYNSKDYGRTALLAADKLDLQASFTGISDGFLAQLPEGWTSQRAYLDQLPLADARAAVQDRINAGVALTSYVGHSSYTDWSFSGLFKVADARALTNAGRPTVVVQWGCWNSYYVLPNYNTLGHQLLVAGDRGAAAVLGAATLTETTSDRALGDLVTPYLAQPGMSIGQALYLAKAQLGITQPDRVDVLLGWTLLGDPTLMVDRP
jgi:hypothetical protein